MTQHTPVTEADLDRIEAILETVPLGPESMLLDEIQAVLCAVAAGPEPVSVDVWFPTLVGEAPAWESPEQEAELRDLLVRYAADIAATLASGEDVLPLLYPMEEGSEELDYTTWANAYLFGTELTETDWFDAAGNFGEDLFELLYPLLLLSGALEEDVRQRGERWLTPDEEARATEESMEIMPLLPQKIHAFWRVASKPVQTLRREGGKVGRNDPCPCGSGKKYKQCCGAT